MNVDLRGEDNSDLSLLDVGLEGAQVYRGDNPPELKLSDVEDLFAIYVNEVLEGLLLSTEEEKDCYKWEFRQMLRQPSTYLIYDGDKLIGFLSLELVGSSGWGMSPVYEFDLSAIVAEYRGRGYSGGLFDYVTNEIAEQNNGPYSILIYTPNMEAVAEPMMRRGYRKIPLREYYLLKDGGSLFRKLVRLKEFYPGGGRFVALRKDFEGKDEGGFLNWVRTGLAAKLARWV